MTFLSEHFTFEEATVSETASRKGLNNVPSDDVKLVMKKSAVGMEKIRSLLLNQGIHINSWYRGPELNAAIGSKNTSQHTKGEAIDFICPKFGTPLDICKIIIANADLIRFDQLILEHTWVHVSFAILSGKPRNQVLSLITGNHYAYGLTDMNGKLYA